MLLRGAAEESTLSPWSLPLEKVSSGSKTGEGVLSLCWCQRVVGQAVVPSSVLVARGQGLGWLRLGEDGGWGAALKEAQGLTELAW